MKCKDFNTFSVLCQCCDYPSDIKCCKDVDNVKKNLKCGTSVEIRNSQYEFYYKNNPSGHYARGTIIDILDDNYCKVKLFCNGEVHKIDKSDLRRIRDELINNNY
jgi:hypothetical protein